MKLSDFVLLTQSENIETDIIAFFENRGCHKLAEHTMKVASEAKILSDRFGVKNDAAVRAAYLHDIGRVIPVDQFIESAESFGIHIFNEERLFPGLLHQKISKVMAAEVFGVKDDNVLGAIECHSTLKANTSDIDLILFIADKLSWDEAESKPIVYGIMEGLDKSLEHAALSYISYLCESKSSAIVLHPWTIEAYEDLNIICAN